MNLGRAGQGYSLTRYLVCGTVLYEVAYSSFLVFSLLWGFPPKPEA